MNEVTAVARWVVVPAALLVVATVASCARKVARSPASLGLRDRLGVAPRLWSVIGLLEALAAAGLVAGIARPDLGAAAASGVAGLMAGAVLTHVRAGLGGRWLVPPGVLLAIAVIAGLGFAAA